MIKKAMVDRLMLRIYTFIAFHRLQNISTEQVVIEVILLPS